MRLSSQFGELAGHDAPKIPPRRPGAGPGLSSVVALCALRALAGLAAGTWSGAVPANSGVSDDERAQLEKASARWEELSPTEYSFHYELHCNCSRDETARMRMDVFADTITRATYAENVYEHHWIDGENRFPLIRKRDSAVPWAIHKKLLTPGLVLQELEKLISQPLSEYEAEFDADTGIPCRVWVDVSAGMFDEEFELVLSEFDFKNPNAVRMECAAGESAFVHIPKPATPDRLAPPDG